MQIALVIEPGHARRQLVRANRARLARLLAAGRRDKLVVGHLGFALRLAVDRPRRAMIVRRRVLRAVVGVREDAEAELGVLVKDAAPGRGTSSCPPSRSVGVGEGGPAECIAKWIRSS